MNTRLSHAGRRDLDRPRGTTTLEIRGLDGVRQAPSQIVAERGEDFEATVRRLAADLALLREAGVPIPAVLTGAPKPAAPTPAEPPAEPGE